MMPALRRVAIFALMSALPMLATAQAPAAAPLPFALKPIGPGVYAAIDGPKGESGSNAGFVIGDDGVLVVDSFFNPKATAALIAEIHKLTPKPIRYVVNTHYHIDHVGGDVVLRQAGAVIIAHRNVRGWVRTENLHLFGERVTQSLRDQVAALALPDVTTEAPLTIWLGARKVVVRPERGHTGGDLVVAVPDAKVLFAGDLLWNHVSPNMIDGTIADWIATANGFAADPGANVVVPGHGDVARASDVRAFADYLADVRRLVSDARAKGLSGEALVQATLPPLKALHGDWQAFGYFAPKELAYT
ncbi:MAG: MBL fold metallo-hydrolase, partial [Sphingomonas sp.]